MRTVLVLIRVANRIFGRPKRRCEVNIEIYLKNRV
jgi:hypothetical protein